jgi:hypothetical protein
MAGFIDPFREHHAFTVSAYKLAAGLQQIRSGGDQASVGSSLTNIPWG